LAFKSVRELEEQYINLAFFEYGKLQLLAGGENISEVRLLNDQPQVPVYQVTVQQKYGNVIDVLSHRNNS
jgi:hypothetical protein